MASAGADFFEPALTDRHALVVPTISIFEVYRFVQRKRGRAQALTVVASMRQARVIDLDAGLAVEAAEIAEAHGLPLADSIIYAAARLVDADLWTQDADLEGLDRVHYRARE